MRKLKHREVESLDPGFTVFEWVSWDSDPSCLMPLFAPCPWCYTALFLGSETYNITIVYHFNSCYQNPYTCSEIWSMSCNHTHAFKLCVLCGLWKLWFNHQAYRGELALTVDTYLSLVTTRVSLCVPLPMELPSWSLHVWKQLQRGWAWRCVCFAWEPRCLPWW